MQLDQAWKSASMRAGAFLMAFLTMLGVGVATAAPARAAWSECASRYSCTWGHHGAFTGSGRTWFEHYLYDFGTMDEKSSSVCNNGEYCNSAYYEHRGYSGRKLVVYPGEKIVDLAYVSMGSGLSRNDNISSGRFEDTPKPAPGGWYDCH